MATANQKKTAKDSGRNLFVVEVSATTPDGPITPGEVAVEGSQILKKYPLLFKPLAITYEA